MTITKESGWFKENIMENLGGYEVIEKSFPEGDFGSLEQIEFNSDQISGNIDFWSKGWIGVFVWNNKEEKELLNVLSEPHEEDRIKESFKKLEGFIK